MSSWPVAEWSLLHGVGYSWEGRLLGHKQGVCGGQVEVCVSVAISRCQGQLWWGSCGPCTAQALLPKPCTLTWAVTSCMRKAVCQAVIWESKGLGHALLKEVVWLLSQTGKMHLWFRPVHWKSVTWAFRFFAVLLHTFPYILSCEKIFFPSLNQAESFYKLPQALHWFACSQL